MPLDRFRIALLLALAPAVALAQDAPADDVLAPSSPSSPTEPTPTEPTPTDEATPTDATPTEPTPSDATPTDDAPNPVDPIDVNPVDPIDISPPPPIDSEDVAFEGTIRDLRIEQRPGQPYLVTAELDGDEDNQVASYELIFEEPFEGPAPLDTVLSLAPSGTEYGATG